MLDLSSAQRWSVIERLQRQMLTSKPGSFQHDRADHAVDLALRPERPVRSRTHTLRTLLQDAGRTVSRRQRRHRRRYVPQPSDDSEPRAYQTPDKRTSQPYDALIAAETDAELRDRLASIPQATECFDAMLGGEPVAQTAHRLGVHDHRIEYLRGWIRRLAREIKGGGE